MGARGGRCSRGGQDFHPTSAAPAQQQRHIALRGPGYDLQIGRQATTRDLLDAIHRSGHRARAVRFAEEPLAPQARLWHDAGMRDDAAFQVDDECDHAGLVVGGATPAGYEYVCTDCGARGGVTLRRVLAVAHLPRGDTVVAGEPTAEATELLKAWSLATDDRALAECRHPRYTTDLVRLPSRKTDWRSRCTKCRRPADDVRRRVMRLQDEWPG